MYDTALFESVYSPFQPFLKKNASMMFEPLDLNKRRQVKKVCLEHLDQESVHNPLKNSQ